MPDTAPKSLAVNKTHMAHQLDGGVCARARIGAVVLATDHTLEHEWQTIFNSVPGVGLYHARILNDAAINPTTLKAMEARLPDSVRLLLPGSPFNVVAYGCTSASMVIGEERVAEIIHQVRPEAKATNPVTAVRTGFAKLGVKRFALLTPYIQTINDSLRAYFEARGLEVPVMGSFNIEDDNLVARLSPDTIRQAAIELGRDPSVDAVFVSCTSIRLATVAAEIEAELGKPVTSSNHAMGWHALRLAGIEDKLPQFGKLYSI